jgi:hypothetical protein
MASCSFSIADYHFRTSPGCGFGDAFSIGNNSDKLGTTVGKISLFNAIYSILYAVIFLVCMGLIGQLSRLLNLFKLVDGGVAQFL